MTALPAGISSMKTVSCATSILLLALLLGQAMGQPGDGGGGGGGGGSPSSSASTAVGFCEEDGSSAHYSEVLRGSGSTMIRNTVSLTGCPNHVNYAINPNRAEEVPTNNSVPAYPMFLGSNATTALTESAADVGIAFNGASIFSSWAGTFTADVYENAAFYIEADTFDLCGGHSTAEGQYHYHSTPGCLQEQAMVAAGVTTSDHSPQLGWSYDGFPVYGQLGPDGVEMKLCGATGADATYCLDSCSGYEGELADVDDFKYRYYLSCGFDESFFPFTVNCYRGCCPAGMSCGIYVEACGADAEAAYTAAYTPVEAISLADPYESDLIAGVDTEKIGSDEILNCSMYVGSEATAATGGTPAPSQTPLGTTAPDGGAATPAPSPEGTSVTGETPAPSLTGTEDPMASDTISPTTQAPIGSAETPGPSPTSSSAPDGGSVSDPTPAPSGLDGSEAGSSDAGVLSPTTATFLLTVALAAMATALAVNL